MNVVGARRDNDSAVAHVPSGTLQANWPNVMSVSPDRTHSLQTRPGGEAEAVTPEPCGEAQEAV